ncbi:uncharacterized protein J8A68_001469 [[Candida] subhashii]|uniref:Uncharacterized protein n=1 Tax=[Candida] subhashii TaxID=561895 RepID=A0A8J5QNX0_9ASCO|nr:uncharacterized protein J8A68_001469 [[Candida] subhashii]KAG7665004.1 hypothetical protein J8A68_001469 [[Candida] subhashii]
MGLFTRRQRKQDTYQGFSKYASDINQYNQTQLQHQQQYAPPDQSAQYNAGKAAAIAALRMHSSPVPPQIQQPKRQTPRNTTATQRQQRQRLSQAPRSSSFTGNRANSLQQYVYNPTASYTPGSATIPNARRYSSLTNYSPQPHVSPNYQSIEDMMMHEESDLGLEQQEEEEEDLTIISTSTRKIVDAQGRTQSITTKTIKMLPDGSNIIETTTKNISRTNSRSNSMASGSNRVNSITLSPNLQKIDEHLSDFDYDYQVDSHHLDDPDMKLRLNLGDNTNQINPKEIKPLDGELKPPIDENNNNRLGSIGSSGSKPLRSILKNSRASLDNLTHSPPLQPKASAPMTSSSPPSSIKFNDHVQTISIPASQHKPKPQQSHKPHPTPAPAPQPIPEVDMYAAAMQAAYKKVYGDRQEAIPVSISTPGQSEPKTEEIAKKYAVDGIHREGEIEDRKYRGHHKGFTVHSMRDPGVKQKSRKERVKEEKKLAKEREAEEKRLTKEREVEEKRLTKEREVEEKRLMKEREAEEKKREKERMEEEKNKQKKDGRRFGLKLLPKFIHRHDKEESGHEQQNDDGRIPQSQETSPVTQNDISSYERDGIPLETVATLDPWKSGETPPIEEFHRTPSPVIKREVPAALRQRPEISHRLGTPEKSQEGMISAASEEMEPEMSPQVEELPTESEVTSSPEGAFPSKTTVKEEVATSEEVVKPAPIERAQAEEPNQEISYPIESENAKDIPEEVHEISPPQAPVETTEKVIQPDTNPNELSQPLPIEDNLPVINNIQHKIPGNITPVGRPELQDIETEIEEEETGMSSPEMSSSQYNEEATSQYDDEQEEEKVAVANSGEKESTSEHHEDEEVVGSRKEVEEDVGDEMISVHTEDVMDVDRDEKEIDVDRDEKEIDVDEDAPVGNDRDIVDESRGGGDDQIGNDDDQIGNDVGIVGEIQGGNIADVVPHEEEDKAALVEDEIHVGEVGMKNVELENINNSDKDTKDIGLENIETTGLVSKNIDLENNGNVEIDKSKEGVHVDLQKQVQSAFFGPKEQHGSSNPSTAPQGIMEPPVNDGDTIRVAVKRPQSQLVEEKPAQSDPATSGGYTQAGDEDHIESDSRSTENSLVVPIHGQNSTDDTDHEEVVAIKKSSKKKEGKKKFKQRIFKYFVNSYDNNR